MEIGVVSLATAARRTRCSARGSGLASVPQKAKGVGGRAVRVPSRGRERNRCRYGWGAEGSAKRGEEEAAAGGDCEGDDDADADVDADGEEGGGATGKRKAADGEGGVKRARTATVAPPLASSSSSTAPPTPVRGHVAAAVCVWIAGDATICIYYGDTDIIGPPRSRRWPHTRSAETVQAPHHGGAQTPHIGAAQGPHTGATQTLYKGGGPGGAQTGQCAYAYRGLIIRRLVRVGVGVGGQGQGQASDQKHKLPGGPRRVRGSLESAHALLRLKVFLRLWRSAVTLQSGRIYRGTKIPLRSTPLLYTNTRVFIPVYPVTIGGCNIWNESLELQVLGIMTYLGPKGNSVNVAG
ncbi:hypothetical protein C8J57DRAFT_1251450 [Mycena rebaudengoi]|nr:hypothetical protein C8J57DRAFT_1251450 [Mycena rebaudengoi]